MSGRKEGRSQRVEEGEGRKFLASVKLAQVRAKMFTATSGHRDKHSRKVHASLFTTFNCAIHFDI